MKNKERKTDVTSLRVNKVLRELIDKYISKEELKGNKMSFNEFIKNACVFYLEYRGK